MKIKINFDMDTAALFIAILAVLMTFWQGYEMRVHNRKSVVPVLDFSQNSNLSEGDSGYSLSVTNDGLGPAKIVGSKIFFDGKEEQTIILEGSQTAFPKTNEAVIDYIQGLPLESGQSRTLFTTERLIEVGDIIRAGERHEVLVYDTNIDRENFSGLITLLGKKLNLSVCYCSIYDDQCQKVHYGDSESLTDESCAIVTENLND